MFFRSIVLASFVASAAVVVNGQAVAPANGCLICGDGNVVTAPDAIFVFPGQPETPCDDLQQAGLEGLIPLDQCGYLATLVVDACECAPGDLPSVSTIAPTSFPVSPTYASPTDAPVITATPAPVVVPTPGPTKSPTSAPVYLTSPPVYPSSPEYASPVSSPDALSPVEEAPYSSPVLSPPVAAPITDMPDGGMGGKKEKKESSSEDAGMGSSSKDMGSSMGGMGKRRLFSVGHQTGLIRGL